MFDDIKLKYISNLIDDLDISNKDFAHDISLSEYYFHELINGKKKFSEAVFARICKRYSIDFIDDPSILLDSKNLLRKLIIDIIANNVIQFQVDFKTFNQSKANMVNSIAFFLIPFFEIANNINDGKNFINDELLDRCFTFYELFDSEIAYSFLILYLWCKQIPQDLESMKAMQTKITSDFSNTSIPNCYHGILGFQQGRIYQYSGDYVESIYEYEKASEYLRKDYLHTRVIQCEIQIASIYIDFGRYTKAEKMYKQLLNECKTYGFKTRYNVCLNNLAYLSLLMNKYEQALMYIDIARQESSNNLHLIEYEIVAKYRLNNLKIDTMYFKRLIKCPELSTYAKKIISLVLMLSIFDDDSKISECFNYIYNFCLSNNELTELKFMLTLLTDYYLEKDLCHYKKYASLFINLSMVDNWAN